MLETRYMRLETRDQDSKARWYSGLLLLATCILLLMLSLILTNQALAISSKELIKHPKKYDGKQVSFKGEAVGDVMMRGSHAWIHVNDDFYSMIGETKNKKLGGYNSGQSIWCEASQVETITYVGGYKNKGDIVEVEGTFNRACQEHDGTMDIHAESLRVVEEGYQRKRSLNFSKVEIAGLLVIIFLALLAVWRLRSQLTS